MRSAATDQSSINGFMNKNTPLLLASLALAVAVPAERFVAVADSAPPRAL